MVRKGIWFYVQCTACPLELGANYDADGNPDGEYWTEGDAIAAWNTRVAVTDHDFAMAVHDGELWVRVVKPTWSESDKYRCECGEQLRGFMHRCPACGGWVDYDGVGPKAVLD